MSEMTDLRNLFGSIAPSDGSTEGRFSAVIIPNHAPHRLGRDTIGRPALLIQPVDQGTSTLPPPLTLERLTVQHGARCRITTHEGETQQERFSIVQCVDLDLAPYFLHACGSLVSALGSTPTQLEVTQLVSRLADLFKAFSSTNKSVQGLWAELFVIAESGDPVAVARAWHKDPNDVHDFAEGAQRVEVKCTSNNQRTHRFSAEQVHPGEGFSTVIASLMTTRNAGGVSLLELLDDVQKHLASEPELALHIDSVVSATLGDRLARSLQERFDYDRARETLRFYLSENVPSVSFPFPAEVSAVRFTADLSDAEQASAEELRQRHGFFATLPHENE